MTRRVWVNLAVFLLVFGVMCVWAVRNVITIDALEGPYTIDARFEATAGVAANAEVAYLGVNFGRVGSVDLVEGGVEAELKIDDDRRIPKGSIARIFRKSAIGEPYIDFQPPEGFDPETADADDYYREGDAIPVEDTRIPIEFSELLRTASRLISSIEPEQLASLIHELSLALDGRGDDLRTLTEASDTLTAMFAERTDALDRLAVNNTRLTSVFAEHRDALGQSLTDLSRVAESLRAASGDTSVLLDRGAQLLGEVGDLLDDSRTDIDCLLGNLVAVNDVAADPQRLENTAHLLEAGPEGFGLLAATRDFEPDGVWVRVNLEIALEDPAPQHDPPLALPPVQPIVPCAPIGPSSDSAAAPAGDFDPDDVLGGGAASPLPPAAVATGALAAVAGGLVMTRRSQTGRSQHE